MQRDMRHLFMDRALASGNDDSIALYNTAAFEVGRRYQRSIAAINALLSGYYGKIVLYH